MSVPLPPPLPLSPLPPLRRLLRLGSLLLVFLTATAGATVPLDVAVHRTALARLLLDYNRDSSPDHVVGWAVAPERVLAADMNRDGLDDLVTYRVGVWSIDYDLDGVADTVTMFGGAPGDTPLVGDFDGDGNVDFAIFRNGQWYVRYRGASVPDGEFNFGAPGDIALAADVDGNGTADRIIYRAGQWLVDLDRDGIVDEISGLGGAPADRPFAVDWDGDGGADYGVFRDGYWYVLTRPLTTTAKLVVHAYGGPGDLPLAGRLDRALTAPKFREAASRYGIYRPDRAQSEAAFLTRMLRADDADLILDPASTARRSPATSTAPAAPRCCCTRAVPGSSTATSTACPTTSHVFGGAPGDVPLAGDVDGDGRADLVVYRDGLVVRQHRRATPRRRCSAPSAARRATFPCWATSTATAGRTSASTGRAGGTSTSTATAPSTASTPSAASRATFRE